jgi:putative endonuclease
LKLLWNKQPKPASTTNVGQCSEELAAQHLGQQGLKLLCKNFHSKRGEIDLIMKDGNTLVFVEVKYRKSLAFGGAISAVSRNKQKKLHLCASFYLQKLSLNEYNTACRFDVVTLQGDISQPQITWLKNAF